MRDALEENKTPSIENAYKIKREAEVGRHGGPRRWPIWIVQMICELLVNGAAPSSIPGIILTTTWMFNKKQPDKLPSVNFIRQCRVVVQIIGETLAAIKLARAESWSQLFTDATTRQQISFQKVIVRLMDDDNQLNPLNVSSCFLLKTKNQKTKQKE